MTRSRSKTAILAPHLSGMAEMLLAGRQCLTGSPVLTLVSQVSSARLKSLFRDNAVPNLLPLPVDNYQLSRKLTDQITTRLLKQNNSYFDLEGGLYSLESLFKFLILFRVAQLELPLLYNLTNANLLPQRFDMCNFSLHPSQVEDLMEIGVLGQRNLSEIRFSQTPNMAFPWHLIKCRNLFPKIGKKASVEARDSILIILGTHHELKFARTTLGLIPDKPVHFLLKKEDPNLIRLLQKEMPAGRTQSVSYLEDHRSDPGILDMKEAFGHLGSLYDDVNDQKQPRLKTFLGNNFVRLLNGIEFLILVDRMLTKFSPGLILGSLEKSAFGPALSALQKSHGYKTVSFQHGSIPRSFSMDLMSFEGYFCWNEFSRDTVFEDGFANQEKIYVVGNPVWDGLSSKVKALDEGSNEFDQILSWKGSSALIVAYPQPVKSSYYTLEMHLEFFSALAQYLEARPDVKLLIKHHPSRTTKDTFSWPKALLDSDRIKTVGSKVLSLEKSLEAADVVVSVNSSTLIDALAFGRSALSIDLLGVNKRLPLGFEGIIPIATTKVEVRDHLDNLLQKAGTQDYSSSSQRLVPEFSVSYEERLRQAFTATGVI